MIIDTGRGSMISRAENVLFQINTLETSAESSV